MELTTGENGLPGDRRKSRFLSTGWKGHPEQFIFDRMVKYSSELFKTSILGEPMVVFCGAASNKFLFSNENITVMAWWPSSVHKIFSTRNIVGTDPKEETLKMRKMLPQFLKPEALQRYIGIMDTIAQRHFISLWENKDQVTVYPLTKRYTFLLACRLFMSVEDEKHIAKFSDSFQLITAGIISLPLNLPGTPINKSIKASNFVKKELLKIIKQRRTDLAHGVASPTQDILSHMLLTCDKNGEHMSELNIADKILGLLIGGHDTASVVCTFVVKYLAKLPHIYDKVYQEQMEIANSKFPGELLNWEDLKKMKYSWNVACEVLRLAPPLQGIFREAITDFMFNGFSIPKGWKLYLSISSAHRNPEYFPRPEEFDPTRYEGNGPPPYTYVPFGGGPRMCPGNEYARLEILVFMHNLVKRFKWEHMIPNEKIVFDPFPIPANNLPIRLFPHKA